MTLYLAIISLSTLRKQREQLSKLESKVKHLDSKLNKPFYQEVLQQSESHSLSPKVFDSVLSRLAALEKQVGVERRTTAFQNDLARQAQTIIASYHSRWQETQPVAQTEIAHKLLLYLDEFLAELTLLDSDMPVKSFIQKSLITHIDKLMPFSKLNQMLQSTHLRAYKPISKP